MRAHACLHMCVFFAINGHSSKNLIRERDFLLTLGKTEMQSKQKNFFIKSLRKLLINVVSHFTTYSPTMDSMTTKGL